LQEVFLAEKGKKARLQGKKKKNRALRSKSKKKKKEDTWTPLNQKSPICIQRKKQQREKRPNS